MNDSFGSDKDDQPLIEKELPSGQKTPEKSPRVVPEEAPEEVAPALIEKDKSGSKHENSSA